MFGKKEKTNINKVDTLIGKDSTFRGDLRASGTVRIEGYFQGEINSQGDVIITESGKVEAAIKARNIFIAGFLQGDVEAIGKVDMSATGQLYGNIKVAGISLEEGALFNGNCQMGKQNKLEKLKAK
jgi:cytoskeletal protein CcmA (bactofilin family)